MSRGVYLFNFPLRRDDRVRIKFPSDDGWRMKELRADYRMLRRAGVPFYKARGVLVRQMIRSDCEVVES